MDLQSIAIAAMRHPLKWEKKFCWRKDLNPQPSDYKSGALPVELLQQNREFVISKLRFLDQHLRLKCLDFSLEAFLLASQVQLWTHRVLSYFARDFLTFYSLLENFL